MSKKSSSPTETHPSTETSGTRREILKKAVGVGLLTGAAVSPVAAQERMARTTLKPKIKANLISKTRTIRISSKVKDRSLLKRIDTLLTDDMQLDPGRVEQTIDIIQDILPDIGRDQRTGILTIDIGAVGSIEPTDCTGNSCDSHGCPIHGCTGEACDTQGCGTQTCNGHGCSPSHGCSKTSFGDASDLTEFAQDMLGSAWRDLGQIQNEILDMQNFMIEIRSPQAMQIQTRFIR